ncbi:MAG: hypothetical protein K0Q53_73 [Massilibacillus sp.]|jgi:predicted nucleotidyltransferase|nr:hypothetical protein [Massilibacillus sp.]
METLKYKGQEVEFGDKKYVMPDLPYVAYEEFDAFEKIAKTVMSVAEMESAPFLKPLKKEVFANIRELLYLAIRRNYPELTEEEFKDQINPGNGLAAFKKLVDREIEIQGIIKQVTEKNEETQTEQADKKKNQTIQK